MERPIEGKNLMLFIDPTNGANYSLIVCLTSQSYNRAANVINADSKCGSRKLNGTKDRTIELEGQVMYSPDSGRVSEGVLNGLFENDTPVGWKWAQAVPEDGDEIYSGIDAVISNLVMTAPLENVTTFTATMQITGVPIFTIFEGS